MRSQLLKVRTFLLKFIQFFSTYPRTVMLFSLGLLTNIALWYLGLWMANSYDFPDRGEYLKLPSGVSIFYRQVGKGPDLVALHGIGASQRIWKDLEPELSKNFKLTLIDLPGFGRSSKNISHTYDLDTQSKNILKALEKLNIKNYYLVGSSMGAAISLAMAREQPNNVLKVIAIGPATSSKLLTIPFYKFAQISIITKYFLNPITMRISISNVLNHSELITMDRLLYSLKSFHNHPDSMYTFFKATKAIGDPRLPLMFESVRQPVLILHGEKDHVVKTKYVQDLSKVIPNGKVHFHKIGGHHLMEDEPDWTAHQIIDFINAN